MPPAKDHAAPAGADSPLAAAAEPVQAGLTKLEKQLWHRPDVQGLLPADDDLMDQIGFATQALASQWAPPSPAQLEALRQVEEKTAHFLADLNHFIATDVAAFRRQANDAKIGLLAEEPPIELPKP
jgi:hypothetical protein